eukprot:TRINITY_DN1839_c0_g1_i2.p1 TRINITY_DN1839_c0_g1~~TRINITY_DN1839_c0_g1_i2.p1  ORF type:complete len:131 (-),score=34.87 TRINITY_DN1839_c0_g1_i2:365-757(-)
MFSEAPKKLIEVLDGSAMEAKEYGKDRRFHFERVVLIRSASEQKEQIEELSRMGIHVFVLNTMQAFPEDVAIQYICSEILLNMAQCELGMNILLQVNGMSYLQHAKFIVSHCRDDIFRTCTERAIRKLSS